MSDFAKMPLSHVDAKGRDSNDRHYFGLVRSLTIGVRRMMDWCDRYDAQSGNSDTKKMAIGLMMAMSMLDRTKTPMSLFTQSSVKSLPFGSLFITPDHQHDEKSNFARAHMILEQHGFLLPSTADSECVGAMHQLVQRAVREHLMAPDTPDIAWSLTKGLLDTVEAALKAQFPYEGEDIHSDPSTLPRLRGLRPTVEHWCKLMCDPSTSHLRGYEEGAHDLLYAMGWMLYVDGAYTEAANLQSTVLSFRKRVLDPDNPEIFRAMGSLASTYQKLNRLVETVKLEEEILSFRKRTLPDDHPHIGDAMNNLAIAYQQLKQLDKALKMQKNVLALYKRILPEDHQDIGLCRRG